jgi:surface polysaccharide O-acyltransferase-like enzyme
VEIVTLLQVGAFFSGVAGQWLIARKSIHAFLAWTISNNVLLIGFSVATHAWWLLAMYVVYLVGSLLAWRQWHQKEEKTPHRIPKIEV